MKIERNSSAKIPKGGTLQTRELIGAGCKGSMTEISPHNQVNERAHEKGMEERRRHLLEVRR